MTITVQCTTEELKRAITDYIRNIGCAILNTVFENTVRSVNKCLKTRGGHFVLYITCNILYCNHQVHRDFLITLYFFLLVEGPSGRTTPHH